MVASSRGSVFDHASKSSVHSTSHMAPLFPLRKYGYPPDKQERATQTVLEQAALLSAQWAA